MLPSARSAVWANKTDLLHWFCCVAVSKIPNQMFRQPLLIPWAYQAAFAAVMLFPIIGIIADLRRDGRVHPAWWWGMGAMVVTEAMTDIISFTPIGLALYEAVTAGTPGALVPPLAFPPFPPLS
jgi:hypothetical protein